MVGLIGIDELVEVIIGAVELTTEIVSVAEAFVGTKELSANMVGVVVIAVTLEDIM